MFISILFSENSFLFSILKFNRIVLLIFMNYETVINPQNTAMTIFFPFLTFGKLNKSYTNNQKLSLPK